MARSDIHKPFKSKVRGIVNKLCNSTWVIVRCAEALLSLVMAKDPDIAYVLLQYYLQITFFFLARIYQMLLSYSVALETTLV